MGFFVKAVEVDVDVAIISASCLTSPNNSLIEASATILERLWMLWHTGAAAEEEGPSAAPAGVSALQNSAHCVGGQQEQCRCEGSSVGYSKPSSNQHETVPPAVAPVAPVEVSRENFASASHLH